MKPGAKPFEGAACEKRVKEWIATITEGDYYEIYNSDTKNDLEIVHLKYLLDPRIRVVALGKKAATRLEKLDISHFCLPHPSGRNRRINNGLLVQTAIYQCAQWAHYVRYNRWPY